MAVSVEKVFLADERKFLCGDVRGTTSFHPKSTTNLGDATKCCGGSLKSTFTRSDFRILQQYRAWNGRAAQASGLSPAGSRPLGNGMSPHSAVEVCQFRRSFGVALLGAPLQRHKPASAGAKWNSALEPRSLLLRYFAYRGIPAKREACLISDCSGMASSPYCRRTAGKRRSQSDSGDGRGLRQRKQDSQAVSDHDRRGRSPRPAWCW